jgi:hypothetical protein
MQKVIALRSFISPVHGNIETGDFFTISSDGIAADMAEKGFVRFVVDKKPEPQISDLPIEEIKTLLDAKGITYHARTGKAKLLELLEGADNGDAA